MSRDAEVVVVGAGIMGLATAHALRAAGREVIVLEQFHAGHDRGSSHGATRVFRLAYPEPEWVRLAQEALAGWRELEEESGVELLSLVGLVELVRDLSESSQAALESCGVDCRVLEPASAASEFGLIVPDGFSALLQPEGGIVFAERAHAAFGAGTTVRESVPVARLREDSDRVLVETSAGSLASRAVVVTAGSWARPLLATAGIELDVGVTRETVAYFGLAARARPPAVAEFRTEVRRHAFYALHDPRYGLKVGFNGSGGPADPDTDGVPDQVVLGQISEWAGARFRLEQPNPVHAETCLYTNTKDESFVIERHGRVVVGSACSGHGFKFAPVVGRRLAGLALEALD